ncbi:beta strand repeat-containing protein [Paraburkholderia phenazinium]|uniref:beta strand repeat-containing protein n=1 Tax=Paraburkholderia phenazinium TaxID=60549 RepID=UPI00158DAFBA|nr:hypothetical protein [Paraburkholderia phenazinium]
MMINMTDPSTGAVIVMPGQAGDTVVESTSTLSGASAFQYTEENTQGVQTSGVLLAMNGATDAEYVSGQGVVSDISGFQVSLANGASATVTGSNTLTAGSNVSLTVSGSSNSTSVTGTGTTVVDSGSNDTTTLSGNNDTSVMTGSSSITDSSGSGDVTTLQGTNDGAGVFGANSSATDSGAGGYVALLNSNDSGSVSGTGTSTSSTGSGDYLALNGNSESATVAGANSVANTYGNADTATLGGTGDGAGVFGANSSATASGAGGYVSLLANNDSGSVSGTGTSASSTGSDDYLGLNGSNESATVAGANSTTDTYGTYDTATLTGISDGAGLFGANSWATDSGAGGYVALLANSDSGLVSGTGTSTSSTGSSDYLGLNGTGDSATVTGAGSSAVATGSNVLVNVSGTGDLVNLSANSGSTANLDGGNSDTINAAEDYVSINAATSGDDIVGGGVNLNIASSFSGQVSGNNETIDVTGGNVALDASGKSSTIDVTGLGVTVYATDSQVNFSGAAANNNADNVYGAGNSTPDGGWSQLSAEAAQGIIGTPSVPTTLSDPSADTVAASDPGSSEENDPNEVVVTPVPNPDVTSTPLPDSCPDGTDPIILNLDGGSVQTTSLAGSSASFDMQNNGQNVQTGWGTAGEGYLVYDPNDPGNTTAVTQDSQLVGGFGALQGLAQQVDGSAGGSLTASDALWNNLKVWVDTTGTGQFQSGQLESLAQLGITSINLDGEQVNQNSNGNEILVNSTFTYANGSTGNIAGVNLMYNPNATVSPGATTASLADVQINKLIAGMASYGVQAAGSSVLAASQSTPETLLAVH